MIHTVPAKAWGRFCQLMDGYRPTGTMQILHVHGDYYVTTCTRHDMDKVHSALTQATHRMHLDTRRAHLKEMVGHADAAPRTPVDV